MLIKYRALDAKKKIHGTDGKQIERRNELVQYSISMIELITYCLCSEFKIFIDVCFSIINFKGHVTSDLIEICFIHVGVLEAIKKTI